MGNQNKLQAYPQSLKTSELMTQTVCGNRSFMYLVPPKDALTIERLYTHFVMQFESAISSGDRFVQSIGIVDEIPLLSSYTANYQRRIELNTQADANRRVDIGLDLTQLLKRDNVAYEEGGFDPADDEGFTFVEILLSPNLTSVHPNYLNVGTIEVWKTDALFTTIGIR